MGGAVGVGSVRVGVGVGAWCCRLMKLVDIQYAHFESSRFHAYRCFHFDSFFFVLPLEFEARSVESWPAIRLYSCHSRLSSGRWRQAACNTNNSLLSVTGPGRSITPTFHIDCLLVRSSRRNTVHSPKLVCLLTKSAPSLNLTVPSFNFSLVRLVVVNTVNENREALGESHTMSAF